VAADPPWRLVGELEPYDDLRFVARDLLPDARYRFRVYAVNEAGQGAADEVEAHTAPAPPGACGAPRLAGCVGSVLTVEWDAPQGHERARVASYRVWLRPYTASRAADPSEWFEVAHVAHDGRRHGSVQHVEIHTEDLNRNIGRYLCSVAASTAVGELGPPTPDSISLQLPNPCAITAPRPQGPPALSLCNDDALGSGDRRALLASPGDYGTINLMEPAKAPVRVHILPTSSEEDRIGHFAGNCALDAYDAPGGYYPEPNGGDWNRHRMDLQQPGNLQKDMFQQHEQRLHSIGTDAASFDRLSEDFNSLAVPTAGIQTVRALQTGHGRARQDVVRQELRHKSEMLESSLMRYRQVGNQLHHSPGNELLRQSHEEAEIEAAGYQAEVAVLSQKLNELDDALGAGGQEAW